MALEKLVGINASVVGAFPNHPFLIRHFKRQPARLSEEVDRAPDIVADVVVTEKTSIQFYQGPVMQNVLIDWSKPVCTIDIDQSSFDVRVSKPQRSKIGCLWEWRNNVGTSD